MKNPLIPVLLFFYLSTIRYDYYELKHQKSVKNSDFLETDKKRTSLGKFIFFLELKEDYLLDFFQIDGRLITSNLIQKKEPLI